MSIFIDKSEANHEALERSFKSSVISIWIDINAKQCIKFPQTFTTIRVLLQFHRIYFSKTLIYIIFVIQNLKVNKNSI